MARILLIEDNPANLELMVYLLQAFGHTPLTAHDGASGLAAARQETPSLILCDIQLPGLDGYAVARVLRASPGLATLPLVAVTALAMVGDREKILAAGFDGYIAKPLSPEAFVSQVEAFLPAGPRPRRPEAGRTSEAPAPLAPAATTSATVLVVDDAPVNLDLLQGILAPSGYRVQRAGSVRAALDLARASRPDLIVTDLVMRPEGGFDLLAQLQADPALHDIPVIIHSATAAGPQIEHEALTRGAARFLARPIEPEVLLREIGACLDERPQPGELPD